MQEYRKPLQGRFQKSEKRWRIMQKFQGMLEVAQFAMDKIGNTLEFRIQHLDEQF